MTLHRAVTVLTLRESPAAMLCLRVTDKPQPSAKLNVTHLHDAELRTVLQQMMPFYVVVL